MESTKKFSRDKKEMMVQELFESSLISWSFLNGHGILPSRSNKVLFHLTVRLGKLTELGGEVVQIKHVTI